MNHLSLFSGIGGADLAAEWAGLKTVAFCEIDEYCQKVLAKHWPGVPIYDDVRTLTAKSLADRGIEPGTIKTITGGFPCQDVSLSNFGRLGLEGKRSTLWSEYYRIICETEPGWVVVENVLGLLSSNDGRFFGNILKDLATARYDVWWRVLSASAVGAIHERKRLFIVAYPASQRFQKKSILEKIKLEEIRQKPGKGFFLWQSMGADGLRNELRTYCTPDRNDDGISRKLDEPRIKALGNAIVPAQIYPILKAIADYETQN